MRNISEKFANMSIVSAFMVVMIHVLKRDQTAGSMAALFRVAIGEGLCRIAVPFFFLAAGYFVARHVDEAGYWWKEVRKRVGSLLVPYIIWCTITFLVVSILMITSNILLNEPIFCNVCSWGRTMKVYGFNLFSVPEARQLWFVRVLLVYMLVLPIFVKFLSRGICLIVLFVVYLFIKPYSGVVCGEHISEFLNYGLISAEGLVYFSFGIWLRKKGVVNIKGSKTLGILLMTIAGLSALGLRIICPVLSPVLVLLAIPLTMYGCLLLIPEKPICKYLVGLSFPIYVIHLNIVFIYFFLIDNFITGNVKIFFDPGDSIVGELLCFIIVSIASVGIALTIRKFDKGGGNVILFGGR